MPGQEITNPQGAFGYTAGDQKYPRRVEEFVAKVALTEGQAVVFDWTESGEVLQVDLLDVAGSPDDPALMAGVVMEGENPAAGETVKVVVWGFVHANIGDGTIAAGERAVFHASTDGALDGVAADATTVSGDTLGVWLGDEIGTTNQGPLWIDRA